ncbi:MAG: lysophospholipid acyltransferase family protein [Candidatus Omnitrophota bacterium]
MRIFLKATLILLMIFLFIAVLILTRCLFIFSRKKRVLFVSYLLHIFNKILVWILGIQVIVHKEENNLKARGVFFVSNHYSYIDGIVAGSVFPFIFIGKTDLKNWPLLGIMIILSETVFVNRVNIFNIKKEIERVKFLLRNNVNTILFPEGTSSDGKNNITFKSSFFAAPLQSECKIVPLTIEYKKVNNIKINDSNKDLVYWYGDMEFFPHFLGVLGLKRIEVELRVNTALEINNTGDQNSSGKRKYLSQLTQSIIRYQQIQ